MQSKNPADPPNDTVEKTPEELEAGFQVRFPSRQVEVYIGQAAGSWPWKIDPFKLQCYLDGFDRYKSNMYYMV